MKKFGLKQWAAVAVIALYLVSIVLFIAQQLRPALVLMGISTLFSIVMYLHLVSEKSRREREAAEMLAQQESEE